MSIARRFYHALEPTVAAVFFAERGLALFAAEGLDALQAYVCGRAAPLGRVSPALASSVFFNWHPSVLEANLRWDLISPERALELRSLAASLTLQPFVADEDRPVMARAAELLRSACEHCRPEGRPLFAGNAALAWPSDELAAVWHGGNLLREYRGDGHIATLLTHRVSAIDALMMQPAYRGIKPDFLEITRSWGTDAYADARADLVARGLMDADHALTTDGRAFRESIEAETDRLAMTPFDGLGSEACEELLAILEPLAERIKQKRSVDGPRPAAQPSA